MFFHTNNYSHPKFPAALRAAAGQLLTKSRRRSAPRQRSPDQFSYSSATGPAGPWQSLLPSAHLFRLLQMVQSWGVMDLRALNNRQLLFRRIFSESCTVTGHSSGSVIDFAFWLRGYMINQPQHGTCTIFRGGALRRRVSNIGI